MKTDPTAATSTPAAPAMPVVPPMPDPAPGDPAIVIAGLADTAGHASTVLYNYRRDNPAAPDIAQALNLEMTLDKRAIELRTQAITLLGTQVADALAQMHDASKQVDAFLLEIKTAQARLTLASAVIALAAAALVGDAGGILGAVVTVHAALKAARDVK
jgi:hypothetical protein